MSRKREPLPLGDGSEADAARMMNLDVKAFRETLPRLHSRGFPLPDPDTKRFDLDAIAVWRRKRHPHLFSPADLTPGGGPNESVVRDRLREAKDRGFG